MKTLKSPFKVKWPLVHMLWWANWERKKITFRGFWANKWARVAQALATVGLIKWRSMAVEGHSCVASIPFNAFKNLAWQNFTQIAFTKFRTFWIIVFVQLKIEVKSCQFMIETMEPNEFWRFQGNIDQVSSQISGWFLVGICKYKPSYKSHDQL